MKWADIKTAEIEYLERKEYDNVNDDPHFSVGMVEIGSKTIVTQRPQKGDQLEQILQSVTSF